MEVGQRGVLVKVADPQLSLGTLALGRRLCVGVLHLQTSSTEL